jgi:V/A-type H+-transporting ATPase subunit I
MIVNTHKFLIYGPKEEMDRFFSLAQRASFLEFIGIWHKKALELPDVAKKMISALKILRLRKGKEEVDREVAIPGDPAVFTEKVVEMNHSLERLQEEERVLLADIARIAPFGNFSKEDIASLAKEGKRIIQFFCMKSDHALETTLPPEVIYIGTEYDLDYYVAINQEKKQYPRMIEMQVDRPASELRERLSDVREQIHHIEKILKSYAAHIDFLSEGLSDHLNAHHLESAKHDASRLMQDSLFAIEAWVPETRIKGLEGLLSGLKGVSYEEIAIEPMDRVPTCIENTGNAKVGEDLIKVYDIPATTDKDPSKWVLVFFAVFFAMIISDAGYGLLYLALAFFLKWKFPNVTGVGKRMIKLVFILSMATIVWGVFTASFFGIEISPNNPYRKISPLHYLAQRKAEYIMQTKDDVYQQYVKRFPALAEAKDGHDFLMKASVEQDGKIQYVALSNFYDNILMELALVIGILHLSLSFARFFFRHWAGVGWIAFLIGGYLYLPTSVLDATPIVTFLGWVPVKIAHVVGEQLLYVGFGLAVLLTLIQKGVAASMLEAVNVIQVFSDVLSYLRLYALGLAGVVVAATFNSLASNFGFVFGLFVILAGHTVNLVLCVMSGAIHGLRLNFLEWYRYSFEGGGKLFNPLRLIKRH